MLFGCDRRTVVNGRDIIEAPDRYDGRQIVLTGIVQNPRRLTMADGTGYTGFTVLDGSARVAIAAPGTQSVSSGDLVEVRGEFREQLRSGGDVLIDTVEARFVRVLRSATQPPGTPVGPP